MVVNRKIGNIPVTTEIRDTVKSKSILSARIKKIIIIQKMRISTNFYKF